MTTGRVLDRVIENAIVQIEKNETASEIVAFGLGMVLFGACVICGACRCMAEVISFSNSLRE